MNLCDGDWGWGGGGAVIAAYVCHVIDGVSTRAIDWAFTERGTRTGCAWDL